MNDQTKSDANQGTDKAETQVPDISELRPELKSLFDQAAHNQGFDNIEDLAKHSQERQNS